MFPRPANLGPNWMPFNIQQRKDGRIYVAWAENSYEIDEPTEEVPGPGFGRISAYDRDGNLLQDYPNHDLLNAPWGLAIAPGDFGEFSGALVVANSGDGTIAAYDVRRGAELGYMRDAAGEVISVDGIWGLTFGNGVHLGQADHLHFTAGPSEERDGILGKLYYDSTSGPDLNHDSAVDAGDANILFGHWGLGDVGELNGDGVADAADAGMLFAAWTGDAASRGANVLLPEPCGGIRWIVAVFAMSGRRRF